MDWREFLTGRRPREDLYETFPPEKRTDYEPTLLNDGSVLAAARVAARLLFLIAKRGGSRVSPEPVKKLVGILDKALPETAPPHCDDEAARILDWLESADRIPPDERDHDRMPPELDLMLGSDIENRITVAEFAIDEDHDLELEYYEDATNTWPRIRCRPLAIHRAEDREDDLLDPTLEVDEAGETLELRIRTIRWLMPVTRTPKHGPTAREQMGDVLDFPTDRLTSPGNGSGDDHEGERSTDDE